MLAYKKRYLLLVTILGVLITGCAGDQGQLPGNPIDNTLTLMTATTTVIMGEAATRQPTDLPAIVATIDNSNQPPTITPGNTSSQGKELAESVCIVCHSFDRVSDSHKNQAEWDLTVKRMVDHGAPIDSNQQQSIIDYLSATYK